MNQYYLKKLKHRRLIIGSILAVATGSVFWAVIGPAVVLIGIPTPRNSGYTNWWFHEAYAWLSHGGRAPSISEISSTYWLGFAISIIGLSILAAGVIGIILATVREMRARATVDSLDRLSFTNSSSHSINCLC